MPDFIEVGLFVGGKRLTGEAGQKDIVNPANGEVIGAVAQASERQLGEALEAAKRGFETWSVTGAGERAQIIRKAATLIAERLDDLARIMTLEQGKPLGEAKGEWLLTINGLEWAAEEGRRAYGRVVPGRAVNVSQIVHKFPIGPVAAFSPWNFPAWSPTQKIAPALAAGCSMILKPATETPACALMLAEILSEAGLPDGVLNVIGGQASMISKALIASPVIRKVSLTGSVEVGRTIAELSGRNLKKCTMELGGHAPVIVLGDVDAGEVGTMAAGAKFRNAGQICTSPTRFFLHGDIYDRFSEAFVTAASQIKVGDGLDAATTMGPVINDRQVSSVLELVGDAVERGGKVLHGGHRIGNRGSYVEPTIVTETPNEARVFHEEPFGPLAVLRRIDSVDEAIAQANSVPYGLASYAFTHDANAMARLTRGVEAGMLAFNQFAAGAVEAPFGGVKDSGFGSEGGTEGVEGYLQPKFVSHLSSW